MIIDAKRKRTAANAWIESIDPLNGLSIAQAKTIFNAARRHGSPLLQKIYDEIEGADPTLMTCVERRASALSGLGWRAVADASAPDEDAAEEQRRALEKFADGIANLDEAIEHLDLGFFRGFSVVQPVWEGGIVRTVHLLDSWNFLFGEGGELLWNPECSPDPARCEEIRPSARIVALRRRRAIDWPALTVFLRKYIGERDWGRFAERYGIPPVDAVMAPNATKEQRGDYLEAVEAARDGRGVVWPSGSSVSRAEGARGQDPFTAFVEHQEKQIVLMATGGTLTSLAQADTGSLAGGAQMDVWEQIVSRDGVAISGALNRGLFLPFLRERFPGSAPMARIVLGKEAEPTAKEAAQLAGSIRSAGYRVDQSQLEEATGFKLEREETPRQPGFGGFGGFANKAGPQNPSSGVALPLQNAPRGQGATSVPKGAETRLEAILDDFSAKLADEMQDEMFSAAAEALAKDDTADKPAAGGGTGPNPAAGEAALNKTDAQGNEHSEDDGKFTEKDGAGGGGAGDGAGDGGAEADAKADKPEGKDDAGIYSAENAKKVGQMGDWKTLGLPPARDIPPDESAGKVNAEDAKARITAGETVRSALGEDLAIDKRTLKHLQKHSPQDYMSRLTLIDEAKATVERPHEVWADEKSGRRVYMRMYKDPSGRAVLNAVDEVDHVLSWHSNDKSFDHWRRGRLLYVRK